MDTNRFRLIYRKQGGGAGQILADQKTASAAMARRITTRHPRFSSDNESGLTLFHVLLYAVLLRKGCVDFNVFFKCTLSSFKANQVSCHIFWLKEGETGNVGPDLLLLTITHSYILKFFELRLIF